MDTPEKYSCGKLVHTKTGNVINYRLNNKTMNKTFIYCKYKRSDEDTDKLAIDFLNDIRQKHELYMAYIRPIRQKIKYGKERARKLKLIKESSISSYK